MKYLHVLNQALLDIFENDPDVILIGEDLLDPYGGAFKVTSGLSTRFPNRVLATPLSEQAITGIAGGMALRGLKPIVEIMFGDFLTLGMDQILNHITKYHSMYGGEVSAPVIIRTPMGGGRGYGPTHSQSIEKYFLGIPGLWVVAPSRFHHPGKLLQESILLNTPVLFLEHKLLYPMDILIPSDTNTSINVSWIEESSFPVAVISNYQAGDPDVVILTYGGSSSFLETFMLDMKKEEIHILGFLPSLINKVSVEFLEPYVKNSLILILEEGTSGFGWGAEILAKMTEKYGRDLGKVKRISALPSVIPVNQSLEQFMLPGLASLKSEVIKMLEEKYR